MYIKENSNKLVLSDWTEMRNYAGGYIRSVSGTAFVEVTQLKPHREYEFAIRNGLIARII